MDLKRLSGLSGGKVEGVVPLHGDGSARTYWRLAWSGPKTLLLVGPDRAENAAFRRIAAHLAARGVRVPRVYGHDEELGWILVEDLGDENLFGLLKAGGDPLALYPPVLETLVRMQVEGAKGFTLEMGFAPAPYGLDLMVEWEGLYFAREYAIGVAGLNPDLGALKAELETLGRKALKAPGCYFLHRDFQSRNLQRTPEGFAVLDFQGARPGPLGYDAAALLFDPYANLADRVCESLFDRYLGLLSACPGVDVGAVRDSYPHLALMRLMQALGAYGKLGGRLGKPGFLEHAPAALARLEKLRGEGYLHGCPELSALIGNLFRSRA